MSDPHGDDNYPDTKGAGRPANQQWRVYGSYSVASYILDDAGAELVDEVVKLEDIDERLPGLLEQLEISQAENWRCRS